MFLSIQYKMETIEFEFDNDIEDNIIEQLADFVRDNDVFKPQPCNHFVDQEEIFHKYIDPSLREFLTKVKVCVNHNDNSYEEIDAKKYYDNLLDILWYCENGYCITASLICESLNMFIETGEWQYGMISGDFESGITILINPIEWDISKLTEHHSIIDSVDFRPVIWFGLPNEEPEERWMINPYASVNIGEYIWLRELEFSDILDDDPWNCVEFWANECGIYLPDIEKILNSCPIKIHHDMNKEELILAINKLFLEKYGDALK